MAKGKGGKSVSVGPKLRKMHGPKRHMFKEFKPVIRLLAADGVLDKYSNYESFVLACAARGKKNTTRKDFAEFVVLPTKARKDEYFASISK